MTCTPGAAALAGKARSAGIASPAARPAEPQLRQQMQVGRCGPTVGHLDADQQVVRSRLGKLDEDIEVAAVGEDTGIEQLVLGFGTRTLRVGAHDLRVGIGRLRVLVEIL